MQKKTGRATTRKRISPQTTNQEAVQAVRSRNPSWLSALEAWEQADYDGLKGLPPKWMPEPSIKAFYGARGFLFHLITDEKSTYRDIRARFDFLNEQKYGAIIHVLMKDIRPYDDDLSLLVRIYKAVQLGEEEGLRQLAGDAAVAGHRARTAHTNRMAFKDKPVIQRIAKSYWAVHPRAIKKEILNCEEFEAYMKGKKPYADRTLGNWLQEIDPRPLSAKRGPRSRTR